ncbi:MAG: 30S ribosomal protein S14 [Bacteriovoracaceae bacterium]
MARLSSVVKNDRRLKMSKNQMTKRATLKAVIIDAGASDADKTKALKKLSEMPRNGSHTRYRKRCVLTGRPRGIVGDFGLCRNKFRDLAHMGMLPGVTKASW